MKNGTHLGQGEVHAAAFNGREWRRDVAHCIHGRGLHKGQGQIFIRHDS